MYDASTRAIALDLLSRGASKNAVSLKLGISRSALREWLADERGPQGGARPCPAPVDPTPAYAALLGYYLGDGHIFQYARYAALRVACDAKYEAIVRDVEGAIGDVHPGRSVFRVSAPGCVVVQSHWKHWPCLFPQHGPGRKHERHLGMQDWQWAAIEQYPADFLRGLFHSDGCLVRNWATRMVAGAKKRYEYPRWQFANESSEVMRWCGEALDLVDVRWRQTKPNVLSVSRRADVARLTELIGVKS